MQQEEPKTRVFEFPDDLCSYLGRAIRESACIALAEDMKRNGQLQDAVVAPDPDNPGRFLIIIGNHRHRACQIAGLPFRARVLPEMPSDRERIQMQVSENLKRRSLSGFERAYFIADYKATLPVSATWADVAEGLGMKEATVLLHVAPKRIPEALRPSCDGLGLTILCLIGRTPKITDMPKVIEFAQTGATKDQVERFIKKLAKTVGRKAGWVEWTVNGRIYRIQLFKADNGAQIMADTDAINKAVAKYKDAPADGLGFLFPPKR